MEKGYSNKALFVDLSDSKLEIRNLDQEIGPNWKKDWVGGRGLGGYFVTTRVNSKVHALDPENVLVIAPGPMTGSTWPSAGKTVICSKSPATNGYGESSLGGAIGPRIRWAGLDCIAVTGRASEPSILIIDATRGEKYIRPSFKSENALDLGKKLLQEYGHRHSAALTIGPAGKNKVQYACVHGIHHIKLGGEDKYVPRNAGRTGMGAVLGAKNLEGILVKSNQIKDYKPFNPKKYDSFRKKLFKYAHPHPGAKYSLTPHGTPFLVPIVQEIRVFPTKNFEFAQFDGYESLGPKAIKENIGNTAYGCYNCNIRCGKFSKVDGKDVDLEYETIALLGSNLLIKDIKHVARAGLLCDELGLDTISTGNVIGFAMEAKEKGFLNEKLAKKFGIPTSELELLEWGNGKKVLELIEKISKKEGIGAFLATGVRGMKRLMPGTKGFAMEQRGVEYSGYVTTESPLMALAYAMSDYGAHHRKAWVITAERAGECDMRILTFFEDIRTWFDMAGMCKLPWIDLPHPDSKDRKNLVVAEWYKEGFKAMTGFGYSSIDEMLVSSERVYNMIRSWNLVQGQTLEDEMVPERVLKHSYPGEGVEEASTRFKELRREYYREREWTERGEPTRKTLRELGIEELVREFS